MIDWKAEVVRLKTSGMSWTAIAQQFEGCFSGLSEVQVREKVRTAIPRESKSIAHEDKPVGVFSDLHIPFNHPNYLQFVVDTFKRYRVGRVVCLGDLVDNHALSRFDSEPCAMGAYDELDMSIAEVARFAKAFPKVDMCEGNHDAIPMRQAKTIGLGERFLKPYGELLRLPKGWTIHKELIINDVLYKHGVGCAGKDGAYNAAIAERMSTVIGHSHAFPGCKYQASKRDVIFGLNVGCGIDVNAYAFVYGKFNKNRPVLGCGVVFNATDAIFVPMGSEYFNN